MAKDGTSRGGARPGAGRKKKALADKIMEGKALPPVTPLEGVDMPDIKEYLTESQHTGELHADEVYRETWDWLARNGCAQYISPTQLEEYAMITARWIQLERVISEFGFLSRHPTTGAPMTSPFVSMALSFLKQSTLIWYQILQTVKEHSAEPVTVSPRDDMMERLLSK